MKWGGLMSIPCHMKPSMMVLPRLAKPPKKQFKNLAKHIKHKLYEKNPCCHYCGRKLTFEESTLDHKIPRSKSGKTNMKNSVLSCLRCNRLKDDMPYGDFIRKIRKLIKDKKLLPSNKI